MSSSSTHIVLITGANRGIGEGILKVFLFKPNTTVIACVRDIDSSLENDAAAAVKTLESKYGIARIDTIIANASSPATLAPIASITAEEVLNHVKVNSLGPLFLFQATLPLLQKSSLPKFIALGSQAGSISDMDKAPAPMAAYGSSKAMVHYFVRKIHFEHQDIISFAIKPGFVQSESGNAIAQMFGMEKASVPISESANFVVSQIEAATKDTISGRFPALPKGECLW
ncbi:aflatoxin biosynthesis ketoreductase-like protein nor-1 [Tricladium varicosporioides]|nr:aflatoxin biosynthesis ketoreductase-like protein nor-1 [Hymenoscyphus varicosporioides]